MTNNKSLEFSETMQRVSVNYLQQANFRDLNETELELYNQRLWDIFSQIEKLKAFTEDCSNSRNMPEDT